MFKKAKKLNKLMSSLFTLAMFGFFACAIHVFPTNPEMVESNKVAHHNDSQQNNIACVDHNTPLSNPVKNNHLVLDELSIDNSFIDFDRLIVLQKVDNKTFEDSPPKNKVPIFIKNSIFLI